MRRVQKEQIKEFVESLKEAYKEIEKAIELKKSEIAMGLLEQCQEGAIRMGDLIEKTEGEEIKTIPILEEYCELLYQIHEGIAQNKLAKAKQMVCQNLNILLIQIENSVEKEIKVRLEIAFLPYKASMWDSLESVWKAADEDPDCDAYVIPIPYYDKNPDGSFRKKHYEGKDYPKYVPITGYKDYDFEKRKPDMIVIHNPYDDCNFVTSVHPFFFSKNLKQFTRQLVYIPYFILNEINPKEKSAVEGMAHFCTVPGVFYADKVIVQSESMKQIYINVLTEFTKENPKAYWENKILGLGSPKLDKLINTKKEEIEIPKEWLKIIQKMDGSWKKIIFYNTSVGALLQHNERMLEEIQETLQIFRENKEEVALLWRPHPLIQATIESMRPNLWKTYQKMVHKYREEGWGIYDDTVDVDRAVKICDAYYGDPSSVIPLCKSAGKMTLIQMVDS